MESFETKEQATEWMYEKVDDSCIDNDRFAFLDDEKELQEYESKKRKLLLWFI